MLSTKTKSYIRKVLLWFFVSFWVAYIVGAILATIIYGPLFEWRIAFLYLYGFVFSLSMLLYAGPVFFISVYGYLWLNKKYNFEKNLWSIVLLTFFIAIGTIFVIFVPIILTTKVSFKFDSFENILVPMVFISIWIGTLLPRIFLKSLKPGNIP